MSEFEAGSARHAGGRRAAGGSDVEAPPPEHPPVGGRRRKPGPADVSGPAEADGGGVAVTARASEPDTDEATDPDYDGATDPASGEATEHHVAPDVAADVDEHVTADRDRGTAGTGSRWPFLAKGQTAGHWVAPLVIEPDDEPVPSRPAARSKATTEDGVAAVSRPAEPTAGDVAAPWETRDPVTGQQDVVPVDGPPVEAPAQQPAEPAVATGAGRSRVATAARPGRTLAVVLAAVYFAAVTVSAGRLAEAHDLWNQADGVTRAGSVVATWMAVVLLARRCGGRFILIGLFTAVVLGLVAAYPENWALAGAGVTAASVHGVLGMTLTRPATGLRTLRELLLSALIGATGAVVVTGYDVVLRPFRFRVMVLTLVLLGGFALAWRLGHGARSIGRRGVVLIAGGVLVLALSVAYTQAIRAWGSPGVIASVTDLKDWLEDHLGAVPRPIEALVGFPALVWGTAIRTRRRQGWWMCAFGALGAAGVATSLLQPDKPFVDSISATAYDVVIGAVLGLLLVALDRLFTGGGGRRAAPSAPDEMDRPEPPRFAPLL